MAEGLSEIIENGIMSKLRAPYCNELDLDEIARYSHNSDVEKNRNYGDWIIG